MKYLHFDELFSKTEEDDMGFYRNFHKHVKELNIERFANSVWAKDVFLSKGLY